jgi:hypothetical protein
MPDTFCRLVVVIVPSWVGHVAHDEGDNFGAAVEHVKPPVVADQADGQLGPALLDVRVVVAVADAAAAIDAAHQRAGG